jgi:hypothetical protein
LAVAELVMIGATSAGITTSVGISDTTTLSMSQFPKSLLVVLKQKRPRLLLPVSTVTPSDPVALD